MEQTYRLIELDLYGIISLLCHEWSIWNKEIFLHISSGKWTLINKLSNLGVLAAPERKTQGTRDAQTSPCWAWRKCADHEAILEEVAGNAHVKLLESFSELGQMGLDGSLSFRSSELEERTRSGLAGYTWTSPELMGKKRGLEESRWIALIICSRHSLALALGAGRSPPLWRVSSHSTAPCQLHHCRIPLQMTEGAWVSGTLVQARLELWGSWDFTWTEYGLFNLSC